MYDSHTHHASDVQGVADDRHSHTPREIGAADEHDLEMLKRDVNYAESGIRALEQKNQILEGRLAALESKNEGLEEQLTGWSERHLKLQQYVTQLTEAIETLAAHAAGGRE